MKKYVGDFETCAWKNNETYVWAWALCDVDNEKDIRIGNDIEVFFEFLKREKNPILYMHNLSFDGEFILSWLLRNGFRHILNSYEADKNTFETLISETGQFYKFVIYYSKGKYAHKVTIIDSKNMIPFAVEDVAEAFGLKEKKLSIDYKKEREPGHILTKAEEDYIINDVVIIAKALREMFKEGLTHMTQSSNAMKDFKSTLSLSSYTTLFPTLDRQVIKDVRLAYHGGFTYLNPIYKEKDLEDIIVIDCNSLYSYIMKTKPLPYGEPLYYEGQYQFDVMRPLFIQTISCLSFKLKEGKLPTIQIKHRMEFLANEYVTEYNEEERLCLCLTNIDLELFLENYDVKGLRYLFGYKFKDVRGIFNEYIDKWYNKKVEGIMLNNKPMRTMAKLMLNSLSGKFATAIEYRNKIPYIAEDGCVHYKLGEPKQRPGIYAPTSIFITAYGRAETIRTAQKIRDYTIKKYNYDSWIYSDTDSNHVLIKEEDLKEIVEIDSIKMGAWKIESRAKKGRYIKQKTYILEEEGQIKAHCSGMSRTCYSHIEWENFRTGASIPGNLKKKRVPGGIILEETDFTIKDEKLKNNIAKIII